MNHSPARRDILPVQARTNSGLIYSDHRKVVDVLLLLVSLLLLIGCQGVSAGPSTQQQSGSGLLSFANTSVNFGSVNAGSTKTVSTTVTNSGAASATINSVAISTKYFAVTAPGLPITLAAGQSTVINVRFSPNAAGTFSATLAIASTASDSLANIALSGTGTATASRHLTLNSGTQNFGSVTVGSKQSQSITLTNDGDAAVSISKVSCTGIGFQISGIASSLTLDAAQSTTFTVAFAPQSTGSATGAIAITSDASNPTLTMALSGTGLSAGAVASNPTSLGFGSVQVGTKKNLSGTVNNTGGSSITISKLAASGSGFSLSGISAPVTLAAGQGVTFSVSFSPTASGSVSGNITITSNAPNPTLTIPLSGAGATALGQLTVSPTTLGLGNVVVGTSGTASGTLTASGANVTITGASTKNSMFSVSGLSLPLTIAAGTSASFKVTFSPLVSGTTSGSLSLVSNAETSTMSEALTGTGTPAPTHSVNLSWKASMSSSISGYNIYRAVYVNSCGSYSKINAVLNTGTLYTDPSVVDGASYCYATTAVNTSNEESSYSNIVSDVHIPAP